jgi:hypothetical protein
VLSMLMSQPAARGGTDCGARLVVLLKVRPARHSGGKADRWAARIPPPAGFATHASREARSGQTHGLSGRDGGGQLLQPARAGGRRRGPSPFFNARAAHRGGLSLRAAGQGRQHCLS